MVVTLFDFSCEWSDPVFDDDLPLVRALRGESLDNVVMVVRRAGSTAGKFLNVTGRPIDQGP